MKWDTLPSMCINDMYYETPAVIVVDTKCMMNICNLSGWVKFQFIVYSKICVLFSLLFLHPIDGQKELSSYIRFGMNAIMALFPCVELLMD